MLLLPVAAPPRPFSFIVRSRTTQHKADVVSEPRLLKLLTERIQNPRKLVDRAVAEMISEDLRRMTASTARLQPPGTRHSCG